MIISKEEFCNILNDIKKTHDFEYENHALMRKYNCDGTGYIGIPNCEDALIHLLCVMFNCEEDRIYGSDISYFIYDLNMGKDYTPGCIAYKDGTEIDISTAEKLYDYLVENMEKKNE